MPIKLTPRKLGQKCSLSTGGSEDCMSARPASYICVIILITKIIRPTVPAMIELWMSLMCLRAQSYPICQCRCCHANGMCAVSCGGVCGHREHPYQLQGLGTSVSLAQSCTVAAPLLEYWLGLGPHTSAFRRDFLDFSLSAFKLWEGK